MVLNAMLVAGLIAAASGLSPALTFAQRTASARDSLARPDTVKGQLPAVIPLPAVPPPVTLGPTTASLTAGMPTYRGFEDELGRYLTWGVAIGGVGGFTLGYVQARRGPQTLAGGIGVVYDTFVGMGAGIAAGAAIFLANKLIAH